MTDRTPPAGLIGLRALVVITIGVAVGVITGILAYLYLVPGALMLAISTGVVAAVETIRFLHEVIE
ncbi:hypothetical protein ABZU75_14405 [Streptosporangium sp. NPDC005286]|uniref:hypothetical protein n=1 Tax=Streptosporangium sp. NPDC005286 TaxID=3154463 RepID=UPI0033A8EB00